MVAPAVHLTWERALDRAAAWAHEHGHTRIPQRWRDPDGFRLGKWVHNQRTAYREGRRRAKRPPMPAARVAALEALPGWTWKLGTGTPAATPAGARATASPVAAPTPQPVETDTPAASAALATGASANDTRKAATGPPSAAPGSAANAQAPSSATGHDASTGPTGTGPTGTGPTGTGPTGTEPTGTEPTGTGADFLTGEAFDVIARDLSYERALAFWLNEHRAKRPQEHFSADSIARDEDFLRRARQEEVTLALIGLTASGGALARDANAEPLTWQQALSRSAADLRFLRAPNPPTEVAIPAALVTICRAATTALWEQMRLSLSARSAS